VSLLPPGTEQWQNTTQQTSPPTLQPGIGKRLVFSLIKFATSLTSRTNLFALKGQNLELFEIACRLAVRYVVTDSVRRAGNKLRVSAEFADTRHGRQMWAYTYDLELTDVFEVQEDIAKSIAGAVGGETFRAEIVDFNVTTDNVDAWSLTQKARNLYVKAALVEDKGRFNVQTMCSMAKLVGSSLAGDIARDAIQGCGGYGFVKELVATSEEYPLEAIYRDSKTGEIYEGANEI